MASESQSGELSSNINKVSESNSTGKGTEGEGTPTGEAEARPWKQQHEYLRIIKIKKLLFLFLIAFLFSCENKTCKTCTTVITSIGEPYGQMTITFTDIDIPPAPMTITSEAFYSMSPMTITFEACGKDLKEVDGKVVTVVFGKHYTITSKTTCK